MRLPESPGSWHRWRAIHRGKVVGGFTQRFHCHFEAGLNLRPMADKDQQAKAQPKEADNTDAGSLGWFRRMKEGITTKTAEKKENPRGELVQVPLLQNRHRQSRARGGTCGCAATATTTNASAQQRISASCSTAESSGSCRPRWTSANPLQVQRHQGLRGPAQTVDGQRRPG